MLKPNYQQLINGAYLELLQKGFVGDVFRTSNFWFELIPNTNKPIKYLEIGTYYGGNAISMLYTYCKHPESKIYCIDPWADYDGLVEKGHANNNIYNAFIGNITKFGQGPDVENSKFIIKRDTSSNVIPTFEDNFFDIIYIDGNHNPEYIVEDAVLSFRKLKVDGYLIFDDFGWEDANIGINSFITSYDKYIKVLGIQNCQLYLQKIKKH